MTRLLVVLAAWCFGALAEESSEGSRLYFPCQSCHGDQGQGSAPIHAPAIAGQSADYLVRQLQNYRDGVRGDHPDDRYGQQMALMAANLRDDRHIAVLADYVSQMTGIHRNSGPAPSRSGGAALYSVCAACHGANGEGNDALSAPKIGGLDSLYVRTQLRHFRDGVRGYAEQDIPGQQMRASMASVKKESDISVLADYISSLSGVKD